MLKVHNRKFTEERYVTNVEIGIIPDGDEHVFVLSAKLA